MEPDFIVTEFVWTQSCTFAACSPETFGEPVEVRGIVLQVVENGEVIRTDYVAYPRNVVRPQSCSRPITGREDVLVR